MRSNAICKLISLYKVWFLLIVLSLMLTACAPPPPPKNTGNICSIFRQYPDWYHNAKDTEKKWGISVPVQMAIINQESSFDGKARPPRKKLLWIIPWKRPSSALGYSQALKNTWKDYENSIGASGKRTEFSDACDFIGWYSAQAKHRQSISPDNPYSLYLAYHDGISGYAHKTYLKKPWLIKVAHKVSNRAAIYQKQLERCEGGF